MENRYDRVAASARSDPNETGTMAAGRIARHGTQVAAAVTTAVTANTVAIVTRTKIR
jgi:hypothetical protein